jgi:hypothetical protein
MPESVFGLDVAAMIALWFAIHGGDPGPSEVTVDDATAVLVAAALDHQLASRHGEPRQTRAQLEERLASLGIRVLPRDEKTDRSESGAELLQKWCFEWIGVNLLTGDPEPPRRICVAARLNRP